MASLEIWGSYIMTNPPKERKYVECFKSIYNGSCNWCKSREWRKGNKVYAMETPEGKWLACTDKKCYLEQGGKLTLFNNNIVTTEQETPNRGTAMMGRSRPDCPICNCSISSHSLDDAKHCKARIDLSMAITQLKKLETSE